MEFHELKIKNTFPFQFYYFFYFVDNIMIIYELKTLLLVIFWKHE
jgi:hypothetical protein